MDAFTEVLFSRIAFASLQAIVLVGVVYAVCRYTARLGAASRAMLWWLVGAQMVVGITCPVVVGLPLLPATHVVAPASLDLPLDTASSLALRAGAVDSPVAASSASLQLPWLALLFAGWLAVVLLQAAIAAVRGWRVARVVHRAMPHDDVRVETLCARRAREFGLRRSPRLRVSAEVDSPQVVGFWRPTILLPLEHRLADDELDMALMHELAHVRRGDLVLGWIPVLARTLFFFHPAIHLAMREYALCREAACDALVVSRGRQAPRHYGRLLVRLGVSPQPHHALPGASPTFVTLKRRLDMLAQANDTLPRALTWSLVIAIAVAGLLPWRVVSAGTAEPQAATRAAPAAPAAPAASAAPASPAAPHALPAPPALPSPPPPAPPALPPPPPPPPAPPVPPADGASMTSISTIDSDARSAFFFNGEHVHVMSGNANDARRAEAARTDANAYAWFRDGDQAWVVRDPAIIKRINEAYARAARPADEAAVTADRQAELDHRQAVLSGEMAKLSARQSALAVKETDPSSHGQGAYADGHAALAKEQAEVARQMAEIGRMRAAQGAVQAEQGRRQADAAKKASVEVRAILADAVRDHKAQASR